MCIRDRAFTVVENIILGSETTKHGVLDLKKASQDILDLSKKYGLAVDPHAKVEEDVYKRQLL